MENYEKIEDSIRNYGNLYTAMNLKPNCSQQEINDKFKELMAKFLPAGLYTDESTLTYLIKISCVNSILSKPELRKKYDDILMRNIDLGSTIIKECNEDAIKKKKKRI